MLRKKSSRMSFLALGLLCCSIFPSSVFASGYLVVPGSHLAAGGLQETLPALIAFKMRTESGRSYACTALGFEMDSELAVFGNGAGTGGIERNCGDITPAVFVNDTEDNNSNNNRICVLRRATDDYIITVLSNASGGEPARIECMETTLYGGYNTNANPYNFLEITNLTNSTITVQVFATDVNGNPISGLSGTQFAIGKNKRWDVDLHTPAGANKYGLIWVAHDGPYGAIQATVSQYSLALEQRASVPLKPRDQNL